MSQLGNTIIVKRCRQSYQCWWCGESIRRGTSYVKWTWEENCELTTTKVHPECRDAWHEMSANEGYPVEVMFGEFERPNGSLSS